ncbi:unnamed protein product [Ambrosiozyma monospora]|uniref:Unnamed protein product n=1 Tax=Ambrosiozyma monospora TaxID=43982 RepID=A0ACB5TL09_AMBMO|nr:unnamed protein product [Ambrosiozyma monospora]
MTGLDHINDHIIEICCIVTDKDLNILDKQGYESVIHYSKERMDQMDEWCTSHHGASGLTEKVINSEKTLAQVEDELLAYISKFVTEKIGILAGNSIHMDRLFMVREMPKVVDFLTHRLIDVSTIMEVSKRHNPLIHGLLPPKVGAHTAKMDIIESINQLKFYRDNYLKSKTEIDTKAIAAEWAGKDINGEPYSGKYGKDYTKEVVPEPESENETEVITVTEAQPEQKLSEKEITEDSTTSTRNEIQPEDHKDSASEVSVEQVNAEVTVTAGVINESEIIAPKNTQQEQTDTQPETNIETK